MYTVLRNEIIVPRSSHSSYIKTCYWENALLLWGQCPKCTKEPYGHLGAMHLCSFMIPFIYLNNQYLDNNKMLC